MLQYHLQYQKPGEGLKYVRMPCSVETNCNCSTWRAHVHAAIAYAIYALYCNSNCCPHVVQLSDFSCKRAQTAKYSVCVTAFSTYYQPE